MWVAFRRQKKILIIIPALLIGMVIFLGNNSAIRRTILSMANQVNKESGVQESQYRHLSFDLFHDQGFFQRNVSLLKPSEILLPFAKASADTVHVITCGWKGFRFINFLSLLSVMKVHQPLKLVLHYWNDNPVHTNNDDYNLWYEQLADEYSNIHASSLGEKSPDCTKTTEMRKVLAKVLENGGIYISGNILLTQHLHDLRKLPTAAAYMNKSSLPEYRNIAYLSVKKGQLAKNRWKLEADHITECVTGDDLKAMDELKLEQTPCVWLLQNIIPEKIMKTKDSLSQLVRLTYYGSLSPVEPRWSLDNAIPNIGHLMLIGDKPMNMLTYLGIMSLINCVGVDAVYIYIDHTPSGKWAEKLKSNPTAVFVMYQHPQMVYGDKIKSLPNLSDFMRYYTLYRFGGIWFDWDAIVLKPLGYLQGYDFVSHIRFPKKNVAYPNKINTGVLAAKKGSVILREALRAFITYNEKKDFYHYVHYGVLLPYKLYEKYPELVKIEPLFHVQCPRSKCSIFDPDKTPSIRDLTGADWKKVYSLHWTTVVPPELLNEKKLRTSKTLSADVARHVFKCKREDAVEALKGQSITKPF